MRPRGLSLLPFLFTLLMVGGVAGRIHAEDPPANSGGAVSKEADSKATDSAKATAPAAKPDENAPKTAVAPKPASTHALWILVAGLATVLGLIIGLKANAFIALITAGMVVSVLAPGPWADKISRVAVAFGTSTGKIGIVIALASIIGTCMLDSGAADRIVRSFLKVFGEKQSSSALMGSGFVLGIPVFFDTVFYLLVPLARSLHRSTGKNYLKYLLAIVAGGAITHTMVPPTPGPLTMAAQLNIDLGVMIMIGTLVGIPAALVGLAFASIADRIMPIPMRPMGNEPEPQPLKDEELPGLFVSLMPVLLPVFLISANTILKSLAEGIARKLLSKDSLNEAVLARMTEAGHGSLVKAYELSAVFGDANFALMVSTLVALWLVYKQRKLTLLGLADVTESSLMSAGVIILITAGGGAFGEMLRVAEVGNAVKSLFASEGSAGITALLLGFGVSALLKIAQGSSTVAMITASAMLVDLANAERLGFHPVYLATSIAGGSLVGSWMNDSGFWVFSKMGVVTEAETLKSWTILLAILGFTSLFVTILLTMVLPLV
jgi:GntP family gluconate:H+ symporter